MKLEFRVSVFEESGGGVGGGGGGGEDWRTRRREKSWEQGREQYQPTYDC